MVSRGRMFFYARIGGRIAEKLRRRLTACSADTALRKSKSTDCQRTGMLTTKGDLVADASSVSSRGASAT